MRPELPPDVAYSRPITKRPSAAPASSKTAGRCCDCFRSAFGGSRRSSSSIASTWSSYSRRSFLEEPLKPLEKPEYASGYRYTSGGHPHNHVTHDWEVQAAYRHYKQRYGAKALDQLVREYGEHIPTRNLHFLMGTIASQMRTFIVIGRLSSAFDPQELARQGELF